MADKPISRNIAPNVADFPGESGVRASTGRRNRNQLVTAIVSNSSTELGTRHGPERGQDAVRDTAGGRSRRSRRDAAGRPGRSEPGAAAKIELTSIDSPPMAPDMSDMVAAASGPDAPKIERPRASRGGRIEEIKPRAPERVGAGIARDIIPFAAPAQERASRRFGTFTLLAAAVVLAAAFGAMAGVLATTGLTRLAGEPAPAAPTPAPRRPPRPPALQTALTQLRIRGRRPQGERGGDQPYRRHAVRQAGRALRPARARPVRGRQIGRGLPRKTDTAPPKETTGSATPPAAAPLAPVPPVRRRPAVVPGWSVRDVYRGVAMLQSRVGGMVEVEPGDVLPGLGRIETDPPPGRPLGGGHLEGDDHVDAVRGGARAAGKRQAAPRESYAGTVALAGLRRHCHEKGRPIFRVGRLRSEVANG